jgi:hypothetical protein
MEELVNDMTYKVYGLEREELEKTLLKFGEDQSVKVLLNEFYDSFLHIIH